MPGTLARQLLVIALLVSIGLRTAFGAPCCLNAEAFSQTSEIVGAAQDHAAHSGHESASEDAHGGHGDDSTSNPCCSACGPTLPADPVLLALVKPAITPPEPEAIRALKTRPPFPAYDATGPPLQA